MSRLVWNLLLITSSITNFQLSVQLVLAPPSLMLVMTWLEILSVLVLQLITSLSWPQPSIFRGFLHTKSLASSTRMIDLPKHQCCGSLDPCSWPTPVVLHRGWLCPLGHIWHCLETYLVVTTEECGGRGAPGIRRRGPGMLLNILQRTGQRSLPQQRIIQPKMATGLWLRNPGLHNKHNTF